MNKSNEEDLWIILSAIFDDDYILSSPQYIAALCYNAGYKNIYHIKEVFYNYVLPVCILPVFFDSLNAPIDEKKLIIAIKKYKKNIVSQVIMKTIILFFPKKKFHEVFEQVDLELEMVNKKHRLLSN